MTSEKRTAWVPQPLYAELELPPPEFRRPEKDEPEVYRHIVIDLVGDDEEKKTPLD